MNVKSFRHPQQKKMRPCLGKCGKPWLTTIFVRVCKLCREKLNGADDEEYAMTG
jgi:hypothetical protein